MDRTHLDEYKSAIHDAVRRGLEHFRHPEPDQTIDSKAEQGVQQDSAQDLNQAAGDALHMVLTARHLIIADNSRHTRDAAVSMLSGAAQAIDRMAALGTEGKASAECSLSLDESEPKPGTNDAGPVELAARLESERPESLADAIDAAMGFAMLADRRRVLAARGILSAVAIENEVTLAIPEHTARAIEATLEILDQATLPANIGN